MQAGGLTVETKLRLPVMMTMTFNWKEEVKLVLGKSEGIFVCAELVL